MLALVLALSATAGPTATKTITLDDAKVSVTQEKVRDITFLRGEERIACQNWTKKRTKSVGEYFRVSATEMAANPDASWDPALKGVAAFSGSEGDGWCNFRLTTASSVGTLTVEYVTCLRGTGATLTMGASACEKAAATFPATAANMEAIGAALLD